MCMYVCMNVCALSLINWINEKSIIRWVEWLRETNEKKGALYLFSQPQAPNFLYLVLFCFLVFCFTLSFIIFTDLSFPCPCLVMSSPLLYCTVLYCTVLLKHQTLHHFHSFLLLCFLLFSRPLPLLLFLFFCSTLLRCTSLSLCGMHVMSVFVCHKLPSTSSILSCMHS